MAASGGQSTRRRTQPKPRAGTRSKPEPTSGELAREAFAEWGNAARAAAAAMRARREAGGDKPPLSERLNPASTEKGGRIGDAADWLLARGGVMGKLASKLSLGSRAVERLRPGGADSDGAGGGDETPPIPIQESIDVSVPLEVAWELCRRFDDYPEFVDRVVDVKAGRRAVTFSAKVHGRIQETEVEIVDEHPHRRIDWEAQGAAEHSGAASFHALAAGLTRIEVSIDLAPGSPVDRVARRLGVTERAIRTDLRRFKAYAELWQDVAEPVADEEDFDEEDVADDEDYDEEDVRDEEDFDEEDVADEEDFDDEDVRDEEDFDEEDVGDEEEYEEEAGEEEYDDELEPARSR